MDWFSIVLQAFFLYFGLSVSTTSLFGFGWFLCKLAFRLLWNFGKNNAAFCFFRVLCMLFLSPGQRFVVRARVKRLSAQRPSFDARASSQRDFSHGPILWRVSAGGDLGDLDFSHHPLSASHNNFYIYWCLKNGYMCLETKLYRLRGLCSLSGRAVPTQPLVSGTRRSSGWCLSFCGLSLCWTHTFTSPSPTGELYRGKEAVGRVGWCIASRVSLVLLATVAF